MQFLIRLLSSSSIAEIAAIAQFPTSGDRSNYQVSQD